MKKIVMNPDTIARPLSNYSHVVRLEIADTALLFIAGQIAMTAEGTIVGENDIARQTEFVFEQIQKALVAAGGTLQDVVKANIYVTDVSQYDKVAAVRNRHFAHNPPATTFVEVSKLVRPGLMVEIEVQAAIQL